jgi:electron transport complex protein RnfC
MAQTTEEPLALPPSTVPTTSRIGLPPTLVVPLLSDVDVVATGTRVKRGQSIAPDVPAPAAGVLGELRVVRLLDGSMSRAIELTVEGTDEEPVTEATPPRDLPSLIDRLRSAGVNAARHSSPDLLGQLRDAMQHGVDLLVCNLLDVDGGSSLHSKLIREHGAVVIAGVKALAEALKVEKILVAADMSMANRVASLTRKSDAKIKVVGLLNDYPQSDPTLLMFALTGRRLRPQALPTSVKAVLLDGAAAAAVGRCLSANEKMLTVPIEIRDSTRARSHVAVAAVGTPLKFVMEAMGLRDSYTLRAGAALRDVRVCLESIVSGRGELSIDAGLISAAINPDPCIRCGWCVENCPVRINPAGLLEAAQEDDLVLAEQFGLHACIECGICSYVCPSRLPLLDSIRQLRTRQRAGATT